MASIDPSTLTTTTISATTEEDTTDTNDGEVTTLPTEAVEADETDADADVVGAFQVRRRRQLNTQLGNANLGVGDSQVEKHQYDVKHIANQVDTGNDF